MCSLGAGIPLIMSLCSIALSSGAAPDTPYLQNPLTLFFTLTLTISLALVCLPRIFNWGWSVEYFFVASIQLACIGMLGGTPWLCFLLYASIPLPYRLVFFIVYLGVIATLSTKIWRMYQDVRNDPQLLGQLYQVRNKQTFYLQKNDVRLLEKKYRLSLFPNAGYFLLFAGLAFGTMPFAKTIVGFVGLPFPHIFLGIFSIPIDMMALAFLTRGWFVYYHLPKHFDPQRPTVYVDMVTKTRR